MYRTLTSIIAGFICLTAFAQTAEAVRYGASVALPADLNHYRAQSYYWDADEYFFRTSPYLSTTHSLHPYWRNSYYTRRGYTHRITHPLFHRYLEDLYYQGSLGRGSGPYQQIYRPSQTQRCYNYRVRRETYRTPPSYSRCDY